jgi:hypothetical protein
MNPQVMVQNHYKTMQGFNDDSQVAFKSQPPLFQQQMAPMPRMHPMMNYNNQLVAGMQNLNIAGASNCYWDGNNFANQVNPAQQMPVHTNSGAQQMPTMQNNTAPQAYPLYQQM